MAWAHYKPAASERRAIASAWALLEEKCERYLSEANRHLREEMTGCGYRGDRIPKPAELSASARGCSATM